MYVSFYELYGIPESMPLSAALVAFLFCVAPLFGGETILGTKFPRLTKKGKIVSITFGPLMLVLLILGFRPGWVNSRFLEESIPYCNLSSRWLPNGNYEVEWFSDSDYSFVSELNGQDVGSVGSYEMAFGESAVYERFVLSTRNRYGMCAKETVVWNPNEEWNQPLSCEITVDKPWVKMGELYTVKWKIDGPKLAVAKINGQEVIHEDYASYTFSSPLNEWFILEVTTPNEVCERTIVINRNG